MEFGRHNFSNRQAPSIIIKDILFKTAISYIIYNLLYNLLQIGSHSKIITSQTDKGSFPVQQVVANQIYSTNTCTIAFKYIETVAITIIYPTTNISK